MSATAVALVAVVVLVPLLVFLAGVGMWGDILAEAAHPWTDECRQHRARHQPRGCVNTPTNQGDHRP